MKFHRNPSVTLDVVFTCQVCRDTIIHPVRIGPHFFLGIDNIPNGWRIETDENSIRCFCSNHIEFSV